MSIIGTQIVVVLVALVSLLITGVISEVNIVVIVIFVAILAATLGLNTLLFTQLGAPLRNLSTVIAKVAGEPIAKAPDIPSASANRSTGVTPLIQKVYDLSAGQHTSQASASSTDSTSAIITALDKSPLGVLILDASQSIVFANSQVPVRIDTSGKKTLDLIYDDTDTIESWIEHSSQSTVHAERLWTRVASKPSGEKDRRIFDIYGTFHKGRKAETVLVFLDRTPEYGPEDESLDFIAFAAHELRGPITVIRGYLDVLGDELASKLEGDQADLMDRLEVSASQLSSYIKNILNASRYDRRHFRMTLEEDSLAAVYKMISDEMELRAATQDRKLIVKLPDDLPSVAIDRASIAQVLQNLIDNAIKYSYSGGEITLEATTEGSGVRVAVSDQGIGIPSSIMRHIFDKFYRSHRSRDMVAGTGIGLYVTKAIIESHGGTIDVFSSENKGSTFSFTLPTYKSVAEKLEAAHNSNEAIINKRDDRFIDNHSLYRG